MRIGNRNIFEPSKFTWELDFDLSHFLFGFSYDETDLSTVGQDYLKFLSIHLGPICLILEWKIKTPKQ